MTYRDEQTTIEAMRLQEESYICQDYLYHDLSGAGARINRPQNAVNVGCRSSMMQWMQTVVNFTGFDQECVEISMSILDRFLMTKSGAEALNCRETYQLASMVALYTSCKINAPESLTPKLLSELSQGAYSAEQVEEMEWIILMAINWRVNPPTATSFIRLILACLPEDLFQTEHHREAAMELARSQAEYAVTDYELMTVKKSIIAFSAVANSLERLDISFDLQSLLKDNVLSGEKSPRIELDLKEAIMIRKTLREGLAISTKEYYNAANGGDETDAKLCERENSHGSGPVIQSSPRCVNYKSMAT